MKSKQLLCVVLAFSLFTCCNSMGFMLLIPLFTGLAEGIIEGSIGAFTPIAKEGLQAMVNLITNTLNGAGSVANQGMSSAGDLLNQGLSSAGNLLNQGANVASNSLNQGANGAGETVNQGINSLGNLFNQGLNTLGSLFDVGMANTDNVANTGAVNIQSGTEEVTKMLNEMMNEFVTAFSQLFSGGGDLMKILSTTFMNMLNSFFSIFGKAGGAAQMRIGHMYMDMGKNFDAVMKLKLNPTKNSAKIKNEIHEAKTILESHHDNPEQLINNMRSKAPHLSSSMSVAYQKSRQTYDKHMKQMHPQMKTHAQQMYMEVAKSKISLGTVIDQITRMTSSSTSSTGNVAQTGFSTAINMLKNVFSLFKMFF